MPGAKVSRPTELGPRRLWNLRRQIVLNSLFQDDYRNGYGIDPAEAQSFFDGYVEFLYGLAEEDGFFKDHAKDDAFGVLGAYDTPQNLWGYAEAVRASEEEAYNGKEPNMAEKEVRTVSETVKERLVREFGCAVTAILGDIADQDAEDTPVSEGDLLGMMRKMMFYMDIPSGK